MCEPVTALTAVAGGINAFGGLAAASSQKSAMARDWERQMEFRKLNFMRDQGRYKLKLARYDQQIDENALAASSAFAKEQAWLNDQYSAASVKYQNDFINIAKRLKYVGEGNTARRLRSLPFAELGRMKAMQVSNLIRAREKVDGFGRNLKTKLRSANQRAFDAVGQIPMPGIAPPKPDMDMTGASINFLGDVVGTAASAYGAYQKSLPPNEAFKNNSSSFGSYSDVNLSRYPGLFDYQPEVNFFDY